MTYEELKERITGLVSNPDTAANDAIGLLSDLEKDYETMSSLAEKSKTDDEKIRNLQDTNQKLFLSVTGQDDTEEDKNDENPIDWDSLAADDEKEKK